jgi:hypothetical protein
VEYKELASVFWGIDKRGSSENMRVPRGIKLFAKTLRPLGPAEWIEYIDVEKRELSVSCEKFLFLRCQCGNGSVSVWL